MSPFILSFINSAVFALYCYIVSSIILQKRETNIKRIALACIPFLIVYYFILCLLDSVYAIFFSGLCAFLFIRIIFQENVFMSMFISLVIHTLKMIFKILTLFALNDASYLLVNTYKTLDVTAFNINLFSLSMSILFIFMMRKPMRKIIRYISSLRHREIVLIASVYINFLLIVIYQPPYNVFSYQAVADFSVIFLVTFICVYNISREMKMEGLTKHYEEIFEYSRSNEELLYNYKMQVHENKNKLLMIKGMLGGPKKETEKYIDSVLREINENKSQSNYWLTELKYIPIAGVKNFINYKLIKLKELGAEIEVFVSSELEKLNPYVLSDKAYNQLSTILGVVLDNMIESISETKEKLISINIYLEDNKICGDFVNNFVGKIDLNRLNEVGYTTKGEKHGVGLPLVAKITRDSDRFECTPEIVDNFFVQHLTIKICSKENLQKITKKRHFSTKKYKIR